LTCFDVAEEMGWNIAHPFLEIHPSDHEYERRL